MGGPARSTPIEPLSLALAPDGRLVIGNYTRLLLLDESTQTLGWLGPDPTSDCGHPSFFGSTRRLSEGWFGENIRGLLLDQDGALLVATYGSAKVVRIANPW